jgi:predicted TPR repeat methyltransferase
MESAQKELLQVSLEEAMSIAVLFQKHGKLADAEDVYRRVLEIWPDHVDALHFSGVLAHQQGRSEDGLALIDRSLALNSEQADCYNNRGIILKALRRLEEAADAYRHAIALNPRHANAHSNLGVLLRAEGRFAEAEAAYREAIAIASDHADAYHNLGALLASLGRTKEAVECFCRVTTLSPEHRETRRLLAIAHCMLGETEKAVAIVEKWIADEPGNPVARHMLAACSGQAVPPRAPDAYVVKIFDDFASSFDSQLERLSYRAPAIVNALVADAGLTPSKDLVVLDAGCGTGLCGSFMAAYARRLVGVDLSGRMLERAAEKHVYDELHQSELVTFIQHHPGEFDLIVSADTLVYFGELDEVVGAMAAGLRHGGSVVFTVESLESGASGPGYRLQTHGRYCHDRDYVERLLARAGFESSIVRAELRMEAGAPVAGLAVRARLREGKHHA